MKIFSNISNHERKYYSLQLSTFLLTRLFLKTSEKRLYTYDNVNSRLKLIILDHILVRIKWVIVCWF